MNTDDSCSYTSVMCLTVCITRDPNQILKIKASLGYKSQIKHNSSIVTPDGENRGILDFYYYNVSLMPRSYELMA
jgi:hypothetical protein